MEELWKPIEGYEGKYEISNLSNVRSLPRKSLTKTGAFYPVKGKILKQILNNEGYLQVSLYGPRKEFRVHRIMGLHWLEKPLNFRELYICHYDDNKLNNSIENLR